MQITHKFALGASLTMGLGLALLSWSLAKPAQGQQDTTVRAPFQRPDGTGMRRSFPFMGPTTMAASGDYVYVLRGNTLYQFKASGLSMVTQKELPNPQPPPGGPGGGPSGGPGGPGGGPGGPGGPGGDPNN